MNTRKIFLTSLLMLTIFLISCSQQAPATQKGAFVGGTSGIAASFEPLSVKEDNIFTIFDTEDFSLDILLKNKGEETIAAGDLSLKLLGPARNDFSGIPQWELRNLGLIEKISEFNPEGGEEIVSFAPNSDAKFTGAVTGFQDVTWNVEYSYKYKTHLIINDVCFKGDITDPKVCVVEERKTFSVSGAPITVTAVEEDSAGKGITLLRINLQNAGTGDVTSPGEEFDKRFGQVSFAIDEPEKWECKSGGRENQARLVDGNAEIICRLKNPLQEEDLFVKSVKLTLDYQYKELIQEKLRIKESVN